MNLETQLAQLYKLSEKAREKGLDPTRKVECNLARDLADLVEGLVGPEGVADSIRDLSTKLPREELAFKIAEEIIYGKFGHLEAEKAAEQAVRTSLAILTEGLTAAPLQGVAKVRIKNNKDRTKYLAIYFAGPIRSAGGTDQALTLVIGDFVRKLIGLDRYKPTEKEIARFIEEVRLYERSVNRFQYYVSDEELKRTLNWLPVEVTGTESDPVEVTIFRNLPRIETNRIRGGALRVVNDGIIGRSSKVWAIIEKLQIQGWNWLKEIPEMSKKQKSAGFMKDVIAGRPVFSFPSQRGGFRLRYGRSRNTGLAAVGVHPVTMKILGGFIAVGTQLKLQFPGKGGIVTPVDTIEPPIIKLKDGSVKRVTEKNLDQIKDKIEKILFLGDILISFGDFLYNSECLKPSGYVEEWWVEDLKNAISEQFDGDLNRAAKDLKIQAHKLRSLLNHPFSDKPNISEAILVSSTLKIPLHPSLTPFWSHLASSDDVVSLRKWLFKAERLTEDGIIKRIVGNMNSNIKTCLETICLPHRIIDEKIVISGEEAHAFAFSLGYKSPETTSVFTGTVLESLENLSGLVIKEKAPTYVGARMGRPEKAARREMKPLVHALFPVGLAGGPHRNIVKAAKHNHVVIEATRRKCQVCEEYSFMMFCPKCGVETIVEKSCPRCGRKLKVDFCQTCNVSAKSYQRQVVNLKELLNSSCSQLEVLPPKILKGVKGLINESKIPEVLEKGILRTKYDLSVYKDGTIRFDATNAPLTHFKPCEIGLSPEKLYELGYPLDINGEPLNDEKQVCELKIQDVIVPKECAEYFLRVTSFIDKLLVKVYDLPPYYQIKTQEDLLGHLIIGLAPHTSVGILGRILGFTNHKVCYAHPIWHSAKRRDCDGDEDALIITLDALLNFSRKYLPAQIGGIMDAPLLLIASVNSEEVQRQAHDFDVTSKYPIEFYEETKDNVAPKNVSTFMDLIDYRLGTSGQYEGFGYTTPVSNIKIGNSKNSYKTLKTMVQKLENQLDLVEKISAVDVREVATKVLTTHFIRDIVGNLRAFSTQKFRCKRCNRSFRRLPLQGECTGCGGQLTLTVYRGGIEKYLDAAQKLIKEYELHQYYAERIMLVKKEISTLFEGKKPKQISLVDFA
jgi:DNA polymerase II large subunit